MAERSLAVTISNLQQVADLFDNGSTLEIRTGAPPATCEAVDTGTLLTTHNMAADPWGNAAQNSPSQAIATAAAIDPATVQAPGGTAGHFRFKDSGGTVIFQGTCGTSSGDLRFDDDNFTTNGTVNITNFFNIFMNI